jgi:hypothetical protein
MKKGESGMKPILDDKVELRITNMFQHAVANQKTSVTYSDVSTETYTPLPPKLSVFQNKRIIFLIVICIILVFPTAGYAIRNVSISELFNEIKQKMLYHEKDNNNIIATVNGSKILVKDFVFYKANLEFIWKMNGVKENKSNMDLLTDMLKEKLLVQYALENGYSVTNAEVDSYIQDIRNHLNQPDISKDMKETMQNRIKLSGLSEEEFWKSSEIVNIYKDYLLKVKVVQKLSMNGDDYKKIIDNLWIQKKDSIKIYKENLF